MSKLNFESPTDVATLVQKVNEKAQLLLHSDTANSIRVTAKDFEYNFYAEDVDIKSFLMGLLLGYAVSDLRKKIEKPNVQSTD